MIACVGLEGWERRQKKRLLIFRRGAAQVSVNGSIWNWHSMTMSTCWFEWSTSRRFMVLGASLLKATACNWQNRRCCCSLPASVQTQQLISVKFCIHVAGVEDTSLLLPLLQSHRHSRRTQVQIYRRGARTFATSLPLCVCCLCAHRSWAVCSLQVAVWHNSLLEPLQSQRGCQSVNQSVRVHPFFCPCVSNQR